MSPGGGDNTAVEQLLLKFGLDLGPVRDGAKVIKAALEELNKIAEEVAKKSAASVASTKKEFDAIKTAAQAAATAQKAQAAATTTQVEAAKVLTAEEAKRTAEILAQNEALKKQVEELKKHQAEHGKKKGGKHEEEEGGLLSKIGKGLAGKLGGPLGAAVAAGGVAGLVTAGAEKAIDLIGELVEKVKEGIMEAEAFNRTWRVLDAAMRGEGLPDATKTINDWSNAVEQAVGQMELMKLGLNVLNAGMQANDPELTEQIKHVKEAGEIYSTAGTALEAYGRFMMTGNARALLMATGLSRQAAVIEKQLVPMYSLAADKMRMKGIIDDMLIEKLKVMEGQAKGFETVFTQAMNIISNNFKNLMAGIEKSYGMQVLLTNLTATLKLINRLTPAFYVLGKAIGNFAGLLLWGTQLIAGFFAGIEWLIEKMEKWYETIKKTEGFQKLLAALQPVADLVAKIAKGIAAIDAWMDKQIGQKKPEDTEEIEAPESEEHKQQVLKEAALQDQYNQAVADKQRNHQQAMTQIRESYLAETLRIEERNYGLGRTLLEDHYKKLELALQAHHTSQRLETVNEGEKQVADLERERAAQQRIVDRYPGLTSKGVYHPMPQAIEAQAQIRTINAKIEAAKRATADKLVNIDVETEQKRTQNAEKAEVDRIKLAETYSQRRETVEVDAIKTLDILNERALAHGKISFWAYMRTRLDLLDQDTQAQVDAIDREEALHATEVENLINLEEKKRKILLAAARQRAEILAQSGETELQWINRIYGQRVAIAEKALAHERASQRGGARFSETQLIEDEKSRVRAQIDATQALFNKTPEGFFKDQYGMQLDDLKHKLQMLNEELAKMHDYAAMIGRSFADIGTGIGKIYTSKFAQNLGQVIGIGAAGMQAARSRGEILSRHVEGQLDAEGHRKPVVFADKMDLFTKKIGAAVGAVTDFVTALTTAQSGISGAIGGAMGGAGLGQTVGGAMAAIAPAMFKSAGPIGAAVGAVVGTVMGAIVGSKNAAIKRRIDSLNQTFKDINDGLKENANTLQLTISKMQTLLQTAREQQAGSKKKGQAEYQKAIDQYISTIKDLQLQIQQTNRDMQQQLEIMQSPLGMQDYLGNLKDIYEQYYKFLGATIVDSKEAAQAQDWLNLSLKKYAETLQIDFSDANMTAINDALQLNDLLYQRQELMTQINDSIRGVLSQGIVTRTATRAQTAGEQIAQIKRQTDRQMEQLNAQIQATQYRVNSEQQIFNLSTTRVGLEMQLVGLQGQQTDKDMDRIRALQDLINQVANGGPNVSALLGTIQSATPGPKPLPAPISGEEALRRIITQSYASRAGYANGSYRGQNL